jgi:hypothetical protein
MRLRGRRASPMVSVRSVGWVVRALAAGSLVSTFVWSFWIRSETIGYAVATENGISHVVAGSSPYAVGISVLGIICFCVLMRSQIRTIEFRAAPLPLRFAAFLLDMWFFIFAIGSVGSFPFLILEARRTGTFKWQFERDYSVSSDNLAVALVFAYLALMVLYFVLPLARRRQTIGGWICRLATVSGNGDVLNLPVSTAAWRVFKEFMGLVRPIKTIKEIDTQGRTWYDRETGFSVVRY